MLLDSIFNMRAKIAMPEIALSTQDLFPRRLPIQRYSKMFHIQYTALIKTGLEMQYTSELWPTIFNALYISNA